MLRIIRWCRDGIDAVFSLEHSLRPQKKGHKGFCEWCTPHSGVVAAARGVITLAALAGFFPSAQGGRCYGQRAMGGPGRGGAGGGCVKATISTAASEASRSLGQPPQRPRSGQPGAGRGGVRPRVIKVIHPAGRTSTRGRCGVSVPGCPKAWPASPERLACSACRGLQGRGQEMRGWMPRDLREQK